MEWPFWAAGNGCLNRVFRVGVGKGERAVGGRDEVGGRSEWRKGCVSCETLEGHNARRARSCSPGGRVAQPQPGDLAKGTRIPHRKRHGSQLPWVVERGPRSLL